MKPKKRSSTKRPKLNIIIDTREQTPYRFVGTRPFPKLERGTLKSGDYSLAGLQERITV